jgi:hypothetical protein
MLQKFWAIVVLTVASFELTPWVTYVAIALYTLVGTVAIVVGVMKRTRLIRMVR